MPILMALKRLLDRRVCPDTTRNTGRNGWPPVFHIAAGFIAADWAHPGRAHDVNLKARCSPIYKLEYPVI
jgi:hypothetical protein